MSWVWTSVICKSLTSFLASRSLTLNTEKSVLTDLTKTSATFLGVDIQFSTTKDTGKKYLSITPSVKKCKSIINKISTYLDTETGSTGTAINNLNPVVRGWASYFRHALSNGTFKKLDYKVAVLYYAWLVRKYPKTPRRTLFFFLVNTILRQVFCQGANLRHGHKFMVKMFTWSCVSSRIPSVLNITISVRVLVWERNWNKWVWSKSTFSLNHFENEYKVSPLVLFE
jgi:hypothetical protein